MRFGAAWRRAPNILRVVFVSGIGAIRDVKQRAPVSAPHRPQLFGTASGSYALVSSRAAFKRSQQPDFRLVDVAATFAPPLARSDATRGKGERLSIRRRGAKELVR